MGTTRMVKLKRVYEPAASRDGLRVLVDRRWPRGLDKAVALIDRWEKKVAPSTALQRWFGGRRVRWAEFCKRYALELDQYREELSRLQAIAAQRPVTLLFAARDEIHNGAAVLQEILRNGREWNSIVNDMNQDELLGFLND